MSNPLRSNDLRNRLADRLDWNLLRTFRIIVQQGSISRAAAQIHLTQPAVSLALKRLEDSVGQKLVGRTGRDFSLTPAGEEILKICDEIYGQVAGAETQLAGKQREVTGLVRLLNVSRLDLPSYDRFLTWFHQSYPRVDLSIEIQKSSDIISAVLGNTISAGVALCRTSVERLEMLPLLRQKYGISGPSHRLFDRKALSLEMLRDEDFVSFTTDQLGDQLAPLTIFRELNGFRGRAVAISSSLDEVRRLIHCGFGIGFLPEHIAREDVRNGRLSQLPPYEGIDGFDIYLIWNGKRKMSAAEAAFLESAREFFQNSAAGPEMPPESLI